MKTEIYRLIILSMYVAFMTLLLTGCEKEEGCYQYTLGVAGETYETIPTNGVHSTIYLEDGFVIQEVCR